MLIASTSKLTGTPGVSGWSQVHEFTPDDPLKIKNRGHLVVIVSTSHTENGIDTLKTGRELLTRFHEEYYGNTDGKPFNVIKDATQKVADEFKNNWGDVEIVATSFANGVVYSSAIGGAGVMILRGGALGKILESGKDEVIVASGYPQDGDRILLATKNFFEVTSQGSIKAALSASTPQLSIEILAPSVLGEGGRGDLGLAIIKFEERISRGVADFLSGTTTPGEENSNISEDNSKRETSNTLHLNTQSFIGKTRGVLEKMIGKLPRFRRSIYLKSEPEEVISPESKKLSFTIAAILLCLLAVSIGFGIRQKKINDLKSKYEGILQTAISEVDQAISLASVSGDKSRELFASSEQKLKEIESLNVKDEKVEALRKKINESRAAVLGEYNVEPQMFLDLTLLSSGFKGDDMSFSGGLVYILDRQGKRIVSVDITNKKSKVVAGPGVIISSYGLAAYEGNAFVLEDDGIYKVDSGNTRAIEKSWAGESFISAFAGNMYVLDKLGNQIYRYSGDNGTFGDKQNWLASGTNVDFSDVKQITIDGSIYVLYPNSRILKFSQGSPQNFSIKGVFPEIGNVDFIYGSPDNQDIYILDRAGKRIVVADKKGNYKAQYVNPQIESALGINVSEENKKMILLTGEKLYSIDLVGL